MARFGTGIITPTRAGFGNGNNTPAMYGFATGNITPDMTPATSHQEDVISVVRALKLSQAR